jgi:hypothetical protein
LYRYLLLTWKWLHGYCCFLFGLHFHYHLKSGKQMQDRVGYGLHAKCGQVIVITQFVVIVTRTHR